MRSSRFAELASTGHAAHARPSETAATTAILAERVHWNEAGEQLRRSGGTGTLQYFPDIGQGILTTNFITINYSRRTTTVDRMLLA